ncbi:MAG: stage 0 sporulation family protein [Phycisphaerae bacterium]
MPSDHSAEQTSAEQEKSSDQPPQQPSPDSDHCQNPENQEQAPKSNDDNGSDGSQGTRPPKLIARYGFMRNIGEFRHNFDHLPPIGSHVVVRTERGVELGEVVANVTSDDGSGAISPDRLEEFIRQNGADYPLRRTGRVLRVANHQDVIDHRHLESSAVKEANFCRELIREMNLDMRLVTVEHLLGGERIVFYFTAEHRVDFRELVRRLAGQYRTRIEMRQVGARDEARLVADYERCGRQCCCQRFLKALQPVSMRMAKVQKATLDPSKISGRCGRLMCCLRYEDQCYRDMKSNLPHRNTWVQTVDGVVGRVVDTQIITQLVKIQLPTRTYIAVPVEEIEKRDIQPPSEGDREESPKPRPKKKEKPRSKRLLRDEPTPSEAPAPEQEQEQAQEKPQEQPKPGKKKKRRRRRNSRSSSKGAAKDGNKAKGSSGGKNRKKRRRRKKPRGKKGDSGGGKSGS